MPASVLVGSNPTTATRYYYAYNGHGDVVALTDASGIIAATYSYDAYGVPASSENLPNGWSNPYRYDGRDGVRYDAETGLYWMGVRAYDPTLGRFISHDPLGRAPLFFADQPYAYAGNNPLGNVDPSGQRYLAADESDRRSVSPSQMRQMRMLTVKRGRTYYAPPCNRACKIRKAQDQARSTSAQFADISTHIYFVGAIIGLFVAALAVLVAAETASIFGIPAAVTTGSVLAALAYEAATVAILGAEAAELATDFSNQANSNTGWDKSSLERFRHVVSLITTGLFSVFATLFHIGRELAFIPGLQVTSYIVQFCSLVGALANLSFFAIANTAVSIEESDIM